MLNERQDAREIRVVVPELLHEPPAGGRCVRRRSAAERPPSAQADGEVERLSRIHGISSLDRGWKSSADQGWISRISFVLGGMARSECCARQYSAKS